MQQEPYFYPSSAEIPPGSSSMPYQNAYPVPPTNVWPNNFNPNISIPTGLYNSDAASLQYGHQAQLLTPVSTAMYGTTSTCSWAHTVPNLMPWVPRTEITVPDPVVRFSAPFPPDPCTSQTAASWELLHGLGENKPSNPNLHLKRKGDLDVFEAIPPKLCITEEKMAARFREMHISNQYTVPGAKALESINDPTSYRPGDKPVTNLQQLEVMLQDSNSSELCSKSLVLAPELKKLVEPEKILSTFYNKIERPSMALVLYQPPSKLLGKENEKEQKEEEVSGSAIPAMENNNNVMPDHLNVMCQQYLSHVHKEDQTQVLAEDSMDI